MDPTSELSKSLEASLAQNRNERLERFTMAAMQGLLASDVNSPHFDYDEVATVKVARATLAELDKQTQS